MANNMFSIYISFFDGQTHTLPIPRGFSSTFIYPSGTITPEGLTFLSNQFYFLNQIRSGMVRCNDFKSMFMLFAHKSSVRESISIKTPFTTHNLKDCSKIFNHTHIGMNNFLTPEGIELIFGSQQFNTALIPWIHITNYNVVFNEYYEYCVAHVTQPPTSNKFGGFGTVFGGFAKSNKLEEFDLANFKSLTEPTTPQKKHKSDEELECPGAPKKGRK